MKLQFPLRLLGYSAAGVAYAFEQLESQRQGELAQTRREISLAKERTAHLQDKLNRLENEFKETEISVQSQMLALLQTHGQSQHVFEQTAARYSEERERLLAEIERQKNMQDQIDQLRRNFGTELLRLAQDFRTSLSKTFSVHVSAKPQSDGESGRAIEQIYSTHEEYDRIKQESEEGEV